MFHEYSKESLEIFNLVFVSLVYLDYCKLHLKVKYHIALQHITWTALTYILVRMLSVAPLWRWSGDVWWPWQVLCDADSQESKTGANSGVCFPLLKSTIRFLVLLMLSSRWQWPLCRSAHFFPELSLLFVIWLKMVGVVRTLRGSSQINMKS